MPPGLGTTPPLIPPTLRDLLVAMKYEIMRELRSLVPGKVKAVNLDGTVDVQPSVMFTNAGGVSSPYPILHSVPVLTLQGSGVAVSLPPAVGDNCLVLFADRCMDSWKVNQGNPAPLPNGRMHSLSDGFALVGVNPAPSALPAPVLGEAGLIASAAGAATAKVATLGGKITIQNAAQSFALTMSVLLTALKAFFTAASTDAGLIAVAPATATAAGVAAIAVQVAMVSLAALFY